MTTGQKRWEEFLLHAEVKDAVAFALAAPEYWETWDPMIPDGRYKLKNGGILKVTNERNDVEYIPPERLEEFGEGEEI